MVGFDQANASNYPADGPFIELLHNDWIGTFGPNAAKMLVADFDAWNGRASKVMEQVGVEYFNDDTFYLNYWWLRSCFAYATTRFEAGTR